MTGAQLFIHFAVILLIYANRATSSENYGPFKHEFQSFGACKGIKLSNISELTTELDSINLFGYINLTVYSEFKLDEIKLRARGIREKKSIVWSYTAKDPCKHFAYSLILKQFFDTDNCVIKKGFYNLKVKFKEIMVGIMGENFFYGTYSTKTEVYSKKRCVGCFSSVMVLTKKTE